MYKKLIEYLPAFMQGFAEMKEITNAEDAEMDRLQTGVRQILSNAFIEDADEDGVERYENILKITPPASDSLEARKIRIINRWNDKLPYSMRVLEKRLNVFCGTGNYVIFGSEEDYELFIRTSLRIMGQVDELEHMMSYMIPENMVVMLENEIINEMTASVYEGAAVAKTVHRTVGMA